VQTDLKEFERGYRRWGNTTLVSLAGLPDGEVPALIHDVSRSTLTGALHLVGESPAVKAGGVLVHAKSETTIEAFPQDIPHFIEVDLSKLLEIDDSLYVRDLVVDASKVELLDEA